MNQIGEEVKVAAIMVGQQTAMNGEQIAIALVGIAELFRTNIEQLKEALTGLSMNTSMTAEEVAIALNSIEPRRQAKKSIHKLNLKRQRITHQVSNRKPQNSVRKIIR